MINKYTVCNYILYKTEIYTFRVVNLSHHLDFKRVALFYMATNTTLNFCLFGQVDTGKSTLAGRLVYECGQIEDHEFNKHKKACAGSEYALWSRFLDIYDEERVRSKTLEFTTIELKHKDNVYNLIDTPGHHSFIRSLIQAMGSYKDIIGCVLVSARKGEFESGWEQTKEDVILAKALGFKDVVVLVNKMDTVGWIKKFTQILNEIHTSW